MLRLIPALLLPLGLIGQPLVPTLLATLPTTLNEVSGTLVVDGAVWVVLDSGNPNALYRIDPTTGVVLRTVTVTNATNIDWEELTTDGAWVYIGDFGNNSGARTNLRIYRFPLSQLQDPGIFNVQVETIAFAYADQVDFTPLNQATNWDCEAFVAMDDSLFLLTKNWADQRCHLYVLPAEPGSHLAVRRDTLEAQGLITGASLEALTGSIALIGYDPAHQPFVWKLSNYGDHRFFDGISQRRPLQSGPMQTEGIAWYTVDSVYFSNELSSSGPPRLWKLHMDFNVGMNDVRIPSVAHFHPNPAKGSIIMEGPEIPLVIRILDLHGAEVLHGSVGGDGTFQLQGLPPGGYVVEMQLQDRIVREPLMIVE